MVSAASRSLPGFASTVTDRVPDPFPGDPAVTLTQVTGLVAVHVHPAIVVTVTWKLSPLPATDCDPDPETVYSQAAANC